MKFQTSSLAIEVRIEKDVEQFDYFVSVAGVPYHHGQARTIVHALDAAIEYLGRKCRVCGCSLLNPCEGGCSWASTTTCSKCADRRRKRTAQFFDRLNLRPSAKSADKKPKTNL